MNRQFNPRTQGVVCIVVGSIALLAAVLVWVSHSMGPGTNKTPVILVIGVGLIAFGVGRLVRRSRM